MDFNEQFAGLLPEILGVRVESLDPAEVIASLEVTRSICTTGDILHGGAIMAFADTLGAVGTFLNLQPGQRTTTLESKTNFLGGAPLGVVVEARCLPLHRGRLTHVWQTTLTRRDTGRLVAQVTQTQMVLSAEA